MATITYEQMMAMYDRERDEREARAKADRKALAAQIRSDREERRKRNEAMELSLQKSREEFQKSREEFNLRMKALDKQLGKLGGRIGQFVEAMIKPAVVRLFRERNIDVHEVHSNVTANREQGSIEIDLLVVNDNDIIAVECKSHLSIDDVNEHLVRMSKIKTLLPTYRDKRLLGAVATMVLEDNVGRYAYSKGLYVLAQSGETVVIKNDQNFRPNYW